MAQRLVRTLCEHCKTATTIDSDVWNELTQPWNVAKPNKVFKADGCLECRNTGYYGRQGLYEILPLSRDLSQLVVDDLNLDELRQCGMREGMRTLRLAGAKKIAAGYTTPEEVLRVTPAMQK